MCDLVNRVFDCIYYVLALKTLKYTRSINDKKLLKITKYMLITTA